jgi:hypothetical protein
MHAIYFRLLPVLMLAGAAALGCNRSDAPAPDAKAPANTGAAGVVALEVPEMV